MNKSHFYDGNFGSPVLFCVFFQCWLRGALVSRCRPGNWAACSAVRHCCQFPTRACTNSQFACVLFFFKTSREVELLLSGWLCEAESIAAFWGRRQGLPLCCASSVTVSHTRQLCSGEWAGSVPAVQQQSCFVTCSIFISVDVRAGRALVWFSGAGLHLQICLLEEGWVHLPTSDGRGNVRQIYKVFLQLSHTKMWCL